MIVGVAAIAAAGPALAFNVVAPDSELRVIDFWSGGKLDYTGPTSNAEGNVGRRTIPVLDGVVKKDTNLTFTDAFGETDWLPHVGVDFDDEIVVNLNVTFTLNWDHTAYANNDTWTNNGIINWNPAGTGNTSFQDYQARHYDREIRPSRFTNNGTWNTNVDTYLYNAPERLNTDYPNPAVAIFNNNEGSNLVVNGKKFYIGKMTNDGTITNNGGEIVWYGDREGNYWNGNGDIVGDGTGQIKFQGNEVISIQINRLNDQAYIMFDGGQTATIGSINSPDACLFLDGNKAKPTDFIPVSAPRITVNGDTTVKSARLLAYEANFNGNVTAIGRIDKSEIGAKYELSPVGQIVSKIEVEKLYDKGGVFFSSALKESGGVNIFGNLTASLVMVSEGYFLTLDKKDYYSILRIQGDLNADNLFIDTPLNYDDQNDFLSVEGTTTITQNIQNNGGIRLNKAIIQGVFYNGTGEYTGTEYTDGIGKTSSEINELDARTIVSKTSLKIGKFTRTYGVSFTQNNGLIQSIENWLDNSTITLTGGILDTDKLGTEKSLGTNNTYTVTGGTLTTYNLGTDSTVSVSDAGILQSNVETVFDNYEAKEVALNVIVFSGETTQLLSEVLTERFKKYTPGNLTEAFEKSVSFDGGKLVLKNVNLTENAKADLEKSFKSKIYSPIQKMKVSSCAFA